MCNQMEQLQNKWWLIISKYLAFLYKEYKYLRSTVRDIDESGDPAPAAFVGVMTYPVTAEDTVAAPVMAHVVALMERPAGSVGTEVHAVKVVPPAVHVIALVEIAASL